MRKNLWTGNRFVVAAWCLAVIPSFLSFGYTIMAAGDLWWHLADGRWILEHKSVPTTDIWSFTCNGRPWLQHEWFSAVLYQLVANVLGMNSLVYVKWAILVGTFVLLFVTMWRITDEPLSSYLGVLLGVATAAPFLDIRPHLFSLLGYVVVLYSMLPRKKPPFYLPLLFLIWANLHAGFLFGLLALLILLVPELISGSASVRRRAGVIWLCSAIACLINPNGAKAFIYPLKYVFDRSSPFRIAIGEWLPPFVPGGIHSPIYVYTIGIFVCASAFILLTNWRQKEQIPWMSLALGVLTLAMSLTSRRFIPLFAISQALVTGQALARLAGPIVASVPPLIGPAFVALLGIIWLWPYPLKPYAFQYLTAGDEFPIETCNFIEANQLSGNVLSYYTWGGYLELRTNGRMKVFVDQRADTVFDAETFRRYAAVQGAWPGWEQVVETSGIDFILWPRDSRGKHLAQLVASGRWRILFDDFVSVLLVRSNWSAAASLRPPPDSAYRHLTTGIKNFEQHRYDVAEKAFKDALKQMPYLRTALSKLADVQKLEGKEEEAWQTTRQARRFFPLPNDR